MEQGHIRNQQIRDSFDKAEGYHSAAVVQKVVANRLSDYIARCFADQGLTNSSFLHSESQNSEPQTILEIYQEHYLFKTINNIPVNMDYFTRYTAYGFYGLLSHWINTNFKTSQEEFIDEIIKLSKTHIAAVKYVGEQK